MANVEAQHETVFDAPARLSRLARVYAEAFLTAAQQTSPQAVEQAGAELVEFANSVAANPDVSAFLASPIVGKKAKLAAIMPALKDIASDLLRGLVGVLTQNNRLDLLQSIAAAYRQLLEERAGRVPVKISVAVPLSDTQIAELTAKLKKLLKQREPVLDVRVDPDLFGGMIVQVGDSVIDTSVRSRLQSIRALLLEKGTYGH
jgi:F-type H+-transporting ATPase subunit delta